MSKPTLDPFTARRMERFVADHRSRTGQLPTFQDFETAGFHRDLVKEAIRTSLLEERYVTLTNGTILKGLVIAPPNAKK